MGYVYMVSSAFFFCLMTIFVKIAGERLPTIQIVFIRGLITLIFTFLLIRRKKVFLWGNNHKILILRGVFGSVALFFVYEAIQRFPLSEATVIQYLFPIFTALFASILLKEQVGKRIYFSILLGVLGVYTVLNFPFISSNVSFTKLSLFIPIIGAFFTGISYVFVRFASNMNESPYVIMFYFPLITVLLSSPFATIGWVSPSYNIWIVLLLVGFSTQLGQVFLTFGYKALPASRAAPISYIQVPFSALAGALIFHEKISYNFFIGSIIIFIAIFFIIGVKNQTN